MIVKRVVKFNIKKKHIDYNYIKQQLIEEKNMLEQKKTDLNDPKVIEDKARHELGLVKPGEVPYVP